MFVFQNHNSYQRNAGLAAHVFSLLHMLAAPVVASSNSELCHEKETLQLPQVIKTHISKLENSAT